jgi:hypothetical protein
MSSGLSPRLPLLVIFKGFPTTVARPAGARRTVCVDAIMILRSECPCP